MKKNLNKGDIKMNDEDIKKIIEDNYDESKEDTYCAMASDFFSKGMRSITIYIFLHFFFFFALAILSAVLFFLADQTKDQIMYAAIFVCLILIGYLIKVGAWIMVGRNSIKREIKRLELRIAELNETVKNK